MLLEEWRKLKMEAARSTEEDEDDLILLMLHRVGGPQLNKDGLALIRDVSSAVHMGKFEAALKDFSSVEPIEPKWPENPVLDPAERENWSTMEAMAYRRLCPVD